MNLKRKKANKKISELKNKLIDALYSEDPLEKILNLLPKMEIGWCGIKTQTGKYFVGAEAKSVLKEAASPLLLNSKVVSQQEYPALSLDAHLSESHETASDPYKHQYHKNFAENKRR